VQLAQFQFLLDFLNNCLLLAVHFLFQQALRLFLHMLWLAAVVVEVVAVMQLAQ
jgi:hypothetical protein